MNLKDHIRHVPDFPKPGILFYDISTLLAHPQAWHETIRQLTEGVAAMKPDLLIGIESRGFLMAAPLAQQLGLGFAMVRKAGKLPGPTITYSYELEYRSDTLEIQEGAVKPGARVVVLDDLLATGGTMSAAIKLLRQVGANVVGAAFIIELAFLTGRQAVDTEILTLMSYDS